MWPSCESLPSRLSVRARWTLQERQLDVVGEEEQGRLDLPWLLAGHAGEGVENGAGCRSRVDVQRDGVRGVMR